MLSSASSGRLIGLVACFAACRSAEVRSTAGAMPAPGERLAAGFRYSVYGPDYNPGPSYWGDVGRKMSARFPGSVPGAVWIVGRLKGQGTELSFPGRSDNALIQFTAEDLNEETLTLFDRAGFETWLQVEPGHAPVEELIHLMLERYGRHPCVVGVGVDVEWYRSIDEPDGQAVSDAEAKAWLAATRAHNPRYRLFLKHWLIEKMPPTAREGLFFIDDSQMLPSLDAMVAEFAEWGRAFEPAPVGFQIGYESDRRWWKRLDDPPAAIGARLIETVPNARGIYWVDFTVLETFPPREHPSGGTAVSEPPGALAVEHVPLFVQFGFDDNGISGRAGSGTSGGLTFVKDLFAGRRNAPGTGNPRTYDGSPALFSLYATTRYIEAAQSDAPEHVKRAWRAILEAGHEIGLHTHRHEHGRAFTSAEWSSEVAECVRWLEKPFDAERAADAAVGIGVSRTAISGFRAPFLEYDRPLFPALRESGIAYDCSIEEGFEDRFDGRNFVWPYRIAAGYGGTSESSEELWEIPVYALIVPPDEACESYGVPKGLRERLGRMRDYFKPADGKVTGFDWNLWVAFAMTGPEVVATFKYTLDQRLLGNRAPLTFGVHSDIYSEQYPTALATTAEERRHALREILDYALARPEVRVVSAKQLLDWLRDPTPLF